MCCNNSFGFRVYNDCGCRRNTCCRPCRPEPDHCCPCPPSPPSPAPSPVPVPGRFLSSHIEAIGAAQTVGSNANVVFNIDETDLVGTGITLNAGGTVFTINQPGLYHVEWSVNLATATQPVIFGLMEAGEPASGMSYAAQSGNLGSGALINVKAEDIPYTVSLHNFGADAALADSTGVANTAVSFRIMRYADGPSV